MSSLNRVTDYLDDIERAAGALRALRDGEVLGDWVTASEVLDELDSAIEDARAEVLDAQTEGMDALQLARDYIADVLDIVE